MLASLHIDQNNMILKSESGNFFDAYFNNTAGYRMAASKSESTFSIIDGKLNDERKSQIYHFDEIGTRYAVGEGEIYSSKEL